MWCLSLSCGIENCHIEIEAGMLGKIIMDGSQVIVMGGLEVVVNV